MKFTPMAIPAMALLQQHDTCQDILIEPAARLRAPMEAWGHSELGAQSGRKDQLACCDTTECASGFGPRSFKSLFRSYHYTLCLKKVPTF